MTAPASNLLVPGRPHVTAQRLNYTTSALAGASDPVSAERLGISSLQNIFAFGNGNVASFNNNPWQVLAVEPEQPFDCFSFTEMLLIQLLQAGVDSTETFAFATTNGDATVYKHNSDMTQFLDFYLADGQRPQDFEAFLILNQNGIPSSAYTTFPTAGPFTPDPETSYVDANTGTSPLQQILPSDPSGKLAFSVILHTLQSIRHQSVVTPPHGGQQWWVDTLNNPVGNNPVPFPAVIP